MNSSEVYSYLNIILKLDEWNLKIGKDLIEYKCCVCFKLHSRTKSNICEIISSSKNKLLTCSTKCANANKKISHEEFVSRCNILFDNKYTYPYTLVNTSTSLIVVCPIHGEFTVKPRTHLQGGKGCTKCYTDTRLKSQTKWLQDCFYMWGTRYEYPEVYGSSHSSIQIICKVHGVFIQTPANHLSGRGCTSCARDSSGFNKTVWLNKSKTSNNFDSYKVYVLLVYSESETFVKIGRTYTTVKYRYGNTRLSTYKYEVLQELIFDSGEDCWNKEIELHRKYVEFSYKPSKHFEGMTECYDSVILKDF